jgi:hypothetical protein
LKMHKPKVAAIDQVFWGGKESAVRVGLSGLSRT